MNAEESKELRDLMWEYFQKGRGGLRDLPAGNLMNKLLELDQPEAAMRLLQIEAIELISHRLGRLIEILERSEQ
jgi:hypothetical protein